VVPEPPQDRSWLSFRVCNEGVFSGTMGVRFSHLAFGAAALFPWTVATSAWGQTWTIAIDAGPNLGKVAMPNSASTFTVPPGTGAVTQTGSGVMISGAVTPGQVHVSCGNQGACNGANVKVVITKLATPTAPLSTLTNFTVGMINASLVGSAPAPAGAITFTLGPIGKNASKSFYVGMNMPVLASGTSTGAGSQGWSVVVSNTDGTAAVSNTTGLAKLTSMRPISVSKSQDLAFGAIVKPASGSGTVTMDAAGTMSFTGAVTSVGAHAPALFKITGEGGAAFSFSLQPTMTMSAGAGTSLLVTTIGSGVYTLGSTLGASGTTSLSVGGSFPLGSTTKSAAYSGSFSVLAIYN
jgi:hypothetical protein